MLYDYGKVQNQYLEILPEQTWTINYGEREIYYFLDLFQF